MTNLNRLMQVLPSSKMKVFLKNSLKCYDKLQDSPLKLPHICSQTRGELGFNLKVSSQGLTIAFLSSGSSTCPKITSISIGGLLS